MAYAVVDDLQQAFGLTELKQLARTPAGGLDEDKAQATLDSASAEVDGYAARRYAVPVDEARIPAPLKQVTMDIARFRLWGARSSEEVRARYDDALRWLRDLAAGRVALVDAEGVELPGPDTPLAAASTVAIAQYPTGSRWGEGYAQAQPGARRGLGPFGG